jgi:hypothetical protein
MGLLPPGINILQWTISLLPLSLFSLAVILNLNNWIFYYFKIGEMASHVDIRAKNLADSDKILKFKRILNFITAIMIAGTVGSLGYLQILIMKVQNDKTLSG